MFETLIILHNHSHHYCIIELLGVRKIKRSTVLAQFSCWWCSPDLEPASSAQFNLVQQTPAGHRSTAWHLPSSPSFPLSTESRHEWIDILKCSVVGHSGVMSSHWRRCQFKEWVQFQFCMFGCFIPMNGPISQGHANTMAAALMGIWCSFKHDVQRSRPAMRYYGGWEILPLCGNHCTE